MKKLLACVIVLLMLGGVFGVAYADGGGIPQESLTGGGTPPQPIPD